MNVPQTPMTVMEMQHALTLSAATHVHAKVALLEQARSAAVCL